MPTYDYKCTHCGHTEEVFHKIDERIQVNCSKCGKLSSKTFSASHSFRFYGEGSYIKHDRNDWD